MPKRPRGRPPLDNKRERVLAICAQIATGSLVKVACAEAGITRETLGVWTAEDKDLSDRYARAREQQAHAFAEQAIDLANSAIPGKEGNVDKVRLQVDTLKWFTSKIAPKLYGEKLTQEVTGANGGPLEVSVRIAREGRRITSS